MSGRIRLLLAACGWLCAVACQAAPDFAAEPASADARYAAAWVLAGADHHERPFAVVDKHDARIYVFEADGRLVGASALPGRNDKGEDIVWIDYAASLAIHRLRPAAASERRPARLASPRTDDNRISAGCIIVPVAFYEAVVARTLGRGPSTVYVLPETRPVHALFESLDLELL